METLYHKIYGEGDPVVIIHGLFGMSDNWSTFAKKLAETHMVILVDVRNHGRSPHFDDFTYQNAAEDIVHLLQENWIYRASIIGHSMGGKIAVQIAADHPDMVEKLIVVDIVPVTYNGGHEKIISALKHVDLDNMKSRGQVEKILKGDLKDLGVVRFLLKNLSRKKEGGFRWKMNLPVLEKAYLDILDQPYIDFVDIPTLFIKGDKSDYIKLEDKDILDNLFENYRLITIADAGHWIHVDQPEKLYSTIIAFLKE